MGLVQVFGNALGRWRRGRELRRHFGRHPMARRPCPLCDASNLRFLARGDRDAIGIATSQCERCGFVFSAPYYARQVIEDFYRERYRAVFKGQTNPGALGTQESYLSERAIFYQRWLEERGIVPAAGGSVLDVGCGEGSLLRALGRARPGLTLTGVEPTIAFARHVATGSGITVVADIADLPRDRRFNLIVLIHVLEHVYHPVDVLRQIQERLADGGTLYVDVPDVAVHASIGDLHLAHSNHFSAHTLGAALMCAGFEVREVASHRPPTLPPSVFALAGVAPSNGRSRPPLQPDPEGRRIAERIAAIDVSRVACWRWRVGELLRSRRASRARARGSAG